MSTVKKDRQIVTEQQLHDIISQCHGSTFVTFIATTDPRSLAKDRKTKEPNPYYTKEWDRNVNLCKVVRVTGLINWNYENSVNNVRERSGLPRDFESQPRNWGSKGRDQKGYIRGFVDYKGKKYLEVKVENILSEKFICQGVEINKKSLGDVLPKERQQEVTIRDYAVKSLDYISFNGVSYTVDHS